MDVLSAEHLIYRYPGSPRRVLNGVSMVLPENHIVAIMGESGCGKTTLGKILAGVLPPSGGQVRFRNQSIERMSRREWSTFRKNVQVIHQDPYAALNPSLTVSESVRLGIVRYQRVSKAVTREKVEQLLLMVGLNPSSGLMTKYPHQLSGGQRQRVSIARAMSTEPSVIIADEAVSMLDVSMRVGILDLLLRLKEESSRPMSYVFITHDFGVVRYFAEGERLMVLYFGQMVEAGKTQDIIFHPQHPYTAALLSAAPIPDPRQNQRQQPVVLKASRQRPSTSSCPLVDRCPWSDAKCGAQEPPKVVLVSEMHEAACHYSELVPVIHGADDDS